MKIKKITNYLSLITSKFIHPVFSHLKLVMMVVIPVLFFSSALETAYAATPISPVVKVRTYSAVQWKFPQELWEWSASIISKWWLLLTNNHVAQNDDEEDALWYIICLTTIQWKMPECNYTAHVIKRSVDLDLALLQLDSKDINWNTVQFWSLPVLEIDYSYVPNDSDKVQAIGYPGIWGDTLTTTNWTVAWTIKYNWFTYIKTDTTIAPGNSWWPMISSNGKQIWLNTFGISSRAESLGYWLLMSEAKKFIEDNADSKPINTATDVDLWSYAKSIDQINRLQKIELPWITYTVPAWYEIKNTIDNVIFSQVPKDQKDVQASELNIGIRSTPTIDNEKTFLYYLESIWAYSKRYTKLVPTTISGKKFFKIVYSRDDTGWEWWGTQVYLGQLHKNAMVYIVMEIDWESEKKLAEVKAEKELMLNNIKFNTIEFNPSFDWLVLDPAITFTKPEEWVGDARWGEWMVLNLTKYVQNLHDWINISVSKSTKATNIQKIYNSDLKDIAKNMKAMWKFQWNDAFITCNEKAEGGYGSQEVDENNKPLQQFSCQITTIIHAINEIPYRVDITIVWPRNTKDAFLNSMMSVLTKELVLWFWKTTLPNLFKKWTTVVFKDLRDQTSAYRKKIDTLIWYNLLKKWEYFWPYAPITYWLLAEKYLHLVHNINIASANCQSTTCLLQNKKVNIEGNNISLFDLFSDVKINWNWYVESDKAEDFIFYMKIKLAGVSLPVYSSETINEIKTDPENPDYAEIYAKIDAYNATLYWSRKIPYEEVLGDDYSSYFKSFFKPTKIVEYIPNKWVLTTSFYSEKPIVFDSIKTVNCSYVTEKPNCVSLKDNDWSFIILTKWDMIDLFIEEMDFWLFDAELAKKKEADIDDGNILDTIDE